jgi:hypothetical protein
MTVGATGVWISASSATVSRWSPELTVRHRIDSTVPARHRSTGRPPTEDHLAGEGLATSTCGRSSPQVAWASRGRSTGTTSILDGMRVALMHDLDTPTALAVVDARAARGPAPAEGDLAAIDALLGIRL